MELGGASVKEFKVYVKNRAGELARVTEALATRAVNITAIASEGSHEDSFLRVVTNDVATTEKALAGAGLRYARNDLLILDLIDLPWELAKVAKRLAKADINVESIYILSASGGKTQLALVVDDLKKAQRLV